MDLAGALPDGPGEVIACGEGRCATVLVMRGEEVLGVTRLADVQSWSAQRSIRQSWTAVASLCRG